jgi:hypothetical protein
LLRKEESLNCAVNFLVLPLTFLSSTFMPAQLVPQWIRDVSRFNPVNWAVEVAARRWPRRRAAGAGARRRVDLGPRLPRLPALDLTRGAYLGAPLLYMGKGAFARRRAGAARKRHCSLLLGGPCGTILHKMKCRGRARVRIPQWP